ncbi:MAG: hypothetical protein LBQ59_00795 [Candidatus Peribacteria bacterium]|jgi:glycosyltransferase involved in cell wall biosynthesis|nr:hypothetical protein [Candidatus Peribacteria bacterium]
MSLSEDEKMKIIQFHVFPFHYFPALIFSLKFKPDIVVNNLWPSAPLSLMIKLFRPKIKLVEFTHNTKFFHFFDKFFSKLVLACCYCCCCSKATKVFLEKEKIRKPFKVLSLLRISSPKIWKPKKQIKLKAMFLGRFSEQKRIDRIIEMV